MYKCLIINLIIVSIVVNSDSYKPILLPNLPYGEYRINYLGLVRCDAIPNKIVSNLYLSKKSANTTEIKGNITNYISFDDSLSGEYRINYLGLVRCVSIPNNILFNLYLSKKSVNTTEIKGNITNYVPLDDSLNTKKVDTVTEPKNRRLVEDTIIELCELKLNIKRIDESNYVSTFSPSMLKGFYKVSGIYTAHFASSYVPKTFFYGVYKFRFFFTKNNEVYGCFILIIELKRLWVTAD